MPEGLGTRPLKWPQEISRKILLIFRKGRSMCRKGGQAKRVGHSPSFNLFLVFGHFLVAFFSLLVTFLPIPLCLPPSAALRSETKFFHHKILGTGGPKTCRLTSPVLSDTARLSQRYPPIARYGVVGASTWPIGCGAPPFSPVESMRSGGATTPLPERGISAILARYHMKTRQMGAIPPSAILSRKGIAR